MTFNAIQRAVFDFCTLSSEEAKTRVGASINRHYRRITSSLGLDTTRYVTRTVSTTIGQQAVQFTEIEHIDRIIDTTDSTAIRLLVETSFHAIRTAQPGTGDPGQWATQSVDADAVTVRLDTIPQSVYSLQADGRTTLSDLSDTDEPAFPESYHDILTFEVISEELLRKDKAALAKEFSNVDGRKPGKAQVLLSELRFEMANSPTRDTRQGGAASAASGAGASGGGGGNQGGSSYTQSGLLTFDRGAGVVPFAVAQSDAPYVPNLGAEFLGNVATDRLIGRDTAGTGESEQLTVTGGVEFSGAGGIRRSALTGDVTAAAGSTTTAIATDAVTTAKILNGAVTYAKIQDVSATSRLLGRKTSGAGDVEELTLSEALDFITSAAQGDLLYRGALAWARLGAGTNGQFLQTQGAAANPQWATPSGYVTVLDRDLSLADVVSSSTETAVYTFAVPGGTLGSTKALRITLIGDYLNNVGAQTLTVRVKYGATTVLSMAASTSANANRGAQILHAMISAAGATNAQRVEGTYAMGEGPANNAAGTMAPVDTTNKYWTGVHNAVAIDSTASQNLVITVQHDASNANLQFRCHAVQVELLG